MKNATATATATASAAAAVMILAAGQALAQSFEISKWTIDGGGAPSLSGGVFTLNGTVGQPDAAGPLFEGDFGLCGGFWPGVIGGPPCPNDLDGSGAVDFGDLIAVLSAWGPCATSCPADFDEDGVVGFSDLIAVLSAWGPCDDAG